MPYPTVVEHTVAAAPRAPHNMIAGFEEEFLIEMDEDKAREVQTVEGAVDFIAPFV